MRIDTKHIHTKGILSDAGAEEGSLLAAFSVFDEVDSDGDVVLASTFTPGQAVPMVYGHKWDSMPIGKGIIRVEPGRALFDGKFFTNTTHGRDAYLTVKEMGDLQEYSWGFRVLDAEPGTLGGQPVRFIKSAEVYEVSPVLVGANRNTHTVAIKGYGRSFEQHTEEVRVAFHEWAERIVSGSETREKDGRAMAARRREVFGAALDAVRAELDRLQAIYDETAPPEKAADVWALFAEFQHTAAALSGAVPFRS